jgi:hypothetical protein
VSDEPDDDGDSSVPGIVARLKPMWARLPKKQRLELGYAWLDTALRKMIPDALVRSGQVEFSELLRGEKEVRSEQTLRAAAMTLALRQVPDHPVELLAAVYDLLASLKTLEGAHDTYECCFAALMTCRLVYGDDRILPEIEQQLRAKRSAKRRRG